MLLLLGTMAMISGRQDDDHEHDNVFVRDDVPTAKVTVVVDAVVDDANHEDDGDVFDLSYFESYCSHDCLWPWMRAASFDELRVLDPYSWLMCL